MFKYILLTLSLITLASCTSTKATPSNILKPAGSATEISSQSAEKILYVDVREDDEWAAGHIEGALHIKLGDIETGNFSTIPKDIPVNLYCRSGRRSAIAYNILKNAGYTNITDVGGMENISGVYIVK